MAISCGIFHFIDVFERLGFGKIIDSCLVKRASWNAIQCSKVIEALFCNYLCSSGCLEDINMFAPQLALCPSTRIPSSDTFWCPLYQLFFCYFADTFFSYLCSFKFSEN